jgi:hypothetical protein
MTISMRGSWLVEVFSLLSNHTLAPVDTRAIPKFDAGKSTQSATRSVMSIVSHSFRLVAETETPLTTFAPSSVAPVVNVSDDSDHPLLTRRTSSVPPVATWFTKSFSTALDTRSPVVPDGKTTTGSNFRKAVCVRRVADWILRLVAVPFGVEASNDDTDVSSVRTAFVATDADGHTSAPISAPATRAHRRVAPSILEHRRVARARYPRNATVRDSCVRRAVTARSDAATVTRFGSVDMKGRVAASAIPREEDHRAQPGGAETNL